MPVQLSYPGVYVEEISSGVKTITGVSTSIAAFIGSAKKGTEEQPTTIFNFGDYERIYGGLSNNSTMSFAVRDFFQNGGGEAVIVRVSNGAVVATATGTTDPADSDIEIVINAASKGEWGNGISFWIDFDTNEDDEDTTLFNLHVTDENGAVEDFLNLSTNENSAAYAINVVKQKSSLIEIISIDEDLSTIDDESIFQLVSGTNGSSISNTEILGSETNKTGLYMLENTDIFNILCIPPYTKTDDIEVGTYEEAMTYCEKRRAILLIDSPNDWETMAQALTGLDSFSKKDDHTAIYFPRLLKPNPLKNNQIESFVPCGSVAGILAKTDTERGVWKAPAGTDANLSGVSGFTVPLTDLENGKLNQKGINCLRSFPVYGKVVWGARTMRGADAFASEWKYIPVRRTALFIEESLYRGLKWVVFEPNDEPLWGQIRLNVGAFMHNLFRKGAFAGSKKDAYFVKCDAETTTQNDINLGIVNIVVGFAPLKPAEFVVLKIQQIAGQIDV